jgi:hypothetical protein
MRKTALALAFVAAPAWAGALGDALEQGDLICEFYDGYRRSLLAEMLGDPLPATQVILFERVTRDSAQAISWHAPGRKEAAVRQTETGVHFIIPVGRSVRTTTLTACERTKLRYGFEVCVRFTAQHAWHFDALALVDPDAALARLPSGASAGVCEPWRLD